jgi:hypothetical protein
MLVGIKGDWRHFCHNPRASTASNTLLLSAAYIQEYVHSKQDRPSQGKTQPTSYFDPVLDHSPSTNFAVSGMLQSTTLLSAPKSTLACDPHAHSLSVAENNRLGNRLSSTYIFAAGMKLQSTTLLFAKNCFALHTKPPAQKQKALRVLLCTRRLRTSGIQSCAGLRTRRFVWTCAYTVSHTGLQSSFLWFCLCFLKFKSSVL